MTPAIIGVITYTLRADGSLAGKWVAMQNGTTDGRIGHEVATPMDEHPNTIAGTYHARIFNPDGVEVYDGTLTLEPAGPSYRLFWRSTREGQAPFDGIGMTCAEGLAAAYWLVEP